MFFLRPEEQISSRDMDKCSRQKEQNEQRIGSKWKGNSCAFLPSTPRIASRTYFWFNEPC